MPVIRRKKSSLAPTFVGTFLIVIMIVSLVLSIGNFIRYREILQKYEEMKKYIDKKVSEVNEQLDQTKTLIGPNSVIDKYISAATQLRDFGYDFEKILSNIYDDPTTGYFMIFVAGNESVWVNIKDKDQNYFSGELKPGLANYKFFYFKEPRIKTNYDIIITPEVTINVGKTGRVYLLFYGVGVKFHPTKIVQLTDVRYENIAEKFSLYIPGR
ncbi:MAG: hypothetical protein ACP5KD_05155 [Fervidobacterium sp.]|jgi:hypothetical protein